MIDEEGDCNDPTHGRECDCGARPDYEYERRKEQELAERADNE